MLPVQRFSIARLIQQPTAPIWPSIGWIIVGECRHSLKTLREDRHQAAALAPKVLVDGRGPDRNLSVPLGIFRTQLFRSRRFSAATRLVTTALAGSRAPSLMHQPLGGGSRGGAGG